MKLFTVNLKAGVAHPVAGKGDYFRILSGGKDFRVVFNYSDGSSRSTMWKVGIGARQDMPFNSFSLESEIDQVVEVFYGVGSIDDNRLIGVGGSRRVSRTVVIPAAVATEVLTEDLSRVTADIFVNCNGRIGDSSVSAVLGFPVGIGGIWEDSNKGSLWMYSPAGGTVDVIEGID